MFSFSAARVMFSSWATTTKYFKLRKSIYGSLLTIRERYDKPKGFGISQMQKSVLLYNRPKGKDKNKKEEKTMKKVEKFLEGLYESYLHR